MQYLAEIHNAGSKIEAHVDVRSYQGEVEIEFATNFAYVDDEITTLDEVNEMLQMLLIDNAYEQWVMEVDEA